MVCGLFCKWFYLLYIDDEKKILMQLQLIQNRIFEVRDEKVMLDFDLAELYEVETRVFNQAVKRNIESFPKDFMFRLTAKEWAGMNPSQSVMIGNKTKKNSSQIVMSSIKHRGSKYLPYAFTESRRKRDLPVYLKVLKQEQ